MGAAWIVEETVAKPDKGDVYARRWIGGSWEEETTLIYVGGNARWPRCAVGPDGSLHLIWNAGGDDYGHLYYSHTGSGGGWSAPQIIPSSRGGGRHSIAVNDAGQVFVTWAANGGTMMAVRSGGAWSSPDEFTPYAGQTAIAAGGTGTPCVLLGSGFVSRKFAQD